MSWLDDPQKLEIIIWDVQHGNAIYMKTPNGKHFCFDIGSGSFGSGQTFSPLAYLSNKWDVTKLDYLVISHPHADHISDIETLFEKSMKPHVLLRPKELSEEFIREANQNQFADIIDRYLELSGDYDSDVLWENNPRNPENNGGVKIESYSQREVGLNNLNNYSFVSVISFGNQKVIIPGDIETCGWNELLKQEDFANMIQGTTILVASHHGRESGFCSDIFDYFTPEITVISDGSAGDTSATSRYSYYSSGAKIRNRKTERETERYVLTTRQDYVIYIVIEYDSFWDSTNRAIIAG